MPVRAVGVAVVVALGVPLATARPPVTSPHMLAEAGCPDGYELYGVLIKKSGAAYLVCRDKNGGGLIYVPLAAGKGRTLDA
jgi:hypothetical protein